MKAVFFLREESRDELTGKTSVQGCQSHMMEITFNDVPISPSQARRLSSTSSPTEKIRR